MNTESFKKIIRETVNEELKVVLPQILNEFFSKTSSTPKNNEGSLKKILDASKSVKENKTNIEKKVYIKNNDVLNDILNETVVKIPNENEMSPMGNSTPSVLDNTDNLPDTLSSVFTKNYSSLLKAVDKKAKEKRS
jgi:hypothetical protein